MPWGSSDLGWPVAVCQNMSPGPYCKEIVDPEAWGPGGPAAWMVVLQAAGLQPGGLMMIRRTSHTLELWRAQQVPWRSWETYQGFLFGMV
jgi:hypothetical protein